VPRAGLRHGGEPPAHGPAGVVIVLKHARAAGEFRDGLGVLWIERMVEPSTLLAARSSASASPPKVYSSKAASKSMAPEVSRSSPRRVIRASWPAYWPQVEPFLPQCTSSELSTASAV